MGGKFKAIVRYIRLYRVDKGHVTSCNHVNMNTVKDVDVDVSNRIYKNNQ